MKLEINSNRKYKNAQELNSTLLNVTQGPKEKLRKK